MDPLKGRGAAENPANRFDRIDYARDEDAPPDEGSGPRTLALKDTSRTIIARNDSPDLGFSASINPYRGCEHGCVYCYARPTHEYAGFSAGLDFETRILVKQDAPELLRQELASPRWEPQVIMLSGVTDCYQPLERKLELTRRCVAVLAECRNPIGVITKNHLVTRDIDLFKELSRHDAVVVNVSVTTLDAELARVMEPRASNPLKRLETIRALAEAGIPVGVMVAPVVPGLTDHELPAILEAAAQAGATSAGYVFLRLPYGVKELFESWLERHYPERKAKVLNQIRESRGGKLYDSSFGKRGRGEGAFADNIAGLFKLAARKHGLDRPRRPLSVDSFRRPQGPQLDLF